MSRLYKSKSLRSLTGRKEKSLDRSMISAPLDVTTSSAFPGHMRSLGPSPPILIMAQAESNLCRPLTADARPATADRPGEWQPQRPATTSDSYLMAQHPRPVVISNAVLKRNDTLAGRRGQAPARFPTKSERPEALDRSRSMVAPVRSGTVSVRDSRASKSPPRPTRWRSLGNIFSSKSANNGRLSPILEQDHSTDTLKGKARNNVTPKLNRSHTLPAKQRLHSSQPDETLGQHPFTGGLPDDIRNRNPLRMNPREELDGFLLNVPIPKASMERYSVMFGGVLNKSSPPASPRLSKPPPRKSSLLGRKERSIRSPVLLSPVSPLTVISEPLLLERQTVLEQQTVLQQQTVPGEKRLDSEANTPNTFYSPEVLSPRAKVRQEPACSDSLPPVLSLFPQPRTHGSPITRKGAPTGLYNPIPALQRPNTATAQMSPIKLEIPSQPILKAAQDENAEHSPLSPDTMTSLDTRSTEDSHDATTYHDTSAKVAPLRPRKPKHFGAENALVSEPFIVDDRSLSSVESRPHTANDDFDFEGFVPPFARGDGIFADRVSLASMEIGIALGEPCVPYPPYYVHRYQPTPIPPMLQQPPRPPPPNGAPPWPPSAQRSGQWVHPARRVPSPRRNPTPPGTTPYSSRKSPSQSSSQSSREGSPRPARPPFQRPRPQLPQLQIRQPVWDEYRYSHASHAPQLGQAGGPRQQWQQPYQRRTPSHSISSGGSSAPREHTRFDSQDSTISISSAKQIPMLASGQYILAKKDASSPVSPVPTSAASLVDCKSLTPTLVSVQQRANHQVLIEGA